MNAYILTASLKFPGAYHTGYQFTVHARTATEALRLGRVKVKAWGHTRQDGPLIWRAKREG